MWGSVGDVLRLWAKQVTTNHTRWEALLGPAGSEELSMCLQRNCRALGPPRARRMCGEIGVASLFAYSAAAATRFFPVRLVRDPFLGQRFEHIRRFIANHALFFGHGAD